MLIALAGLPGAGKSTLAEAIGARIGASVISVDPIESAILSAGIDKDQPTGLAAYLVAEKLAGIVIATGHDVIVDAVNAVDAAREQWVRLAARLDVPLRFIEVACSDVEVHRSRLADRDRGLAPLPEPDWTAVEQRMDEYVQWSGPSAVAPRISLDTVHPLDELVDAALAFVEP